MGKPTDMVKAKCWKCGKEKESYHSTFFGIDFYICPECYLIANRKAIVKDANKESEVFTLDEYIALDFACSVVEFESQLNKHVISAWQKLEKILKDNVLLSEYKEEYAK